jgi:phage terminase large subunit
LNDARKVMSTDEYQQEWYCSFEASVKGAYYATEISEARRNNRIRVVPYDPVLNTHVVFDLGVGSSLVVGFFQRVGNEVKLIDTWQGSGDEGIVHALLAMQRKPYLYGKIFLPHDARAREETTGKSRLEVFENAKYQVEIVPEVSVDDGIDAGKRMFARLWINEPNCPAFVDAIPLYRREWDDNRGDFKPKPYHDWTSHWADMYRYAALVEDQMTNETGLSPREIREIEREAERMEPDERFSAL